MRSLTRRGFVGILAKAALVGGGAAIAAACATPAATPTTAQAAPTATTAAAAAATATKPAAAAAPTATTAGATAPTATTAGAAAPTATTAGAAAPTATKPAAAAAAATATPVPVITAVPQAAGTTKLLMRVHWEGPRLNDFLKYINQYNTEQGPTDKVFMTVERQVSNIQGFVSDFQAGTSEDVYHLSDLYLADLSSRGFFVAAPTEVANYITQTYIASAVGTGTVNGKILGYPTENQPHCIFINTPLFNAAGLDVTKDYPKTYDDIRRLAKQLTKTDASGKKVQAGWIPQNDGSATGPDTEREFVQRVLFQFLNGEPLLDVSTTPPKFNITSDTARKFTALQYGMTQDKSTSEDMGVESEIWPKEKGVMITHDAWAVIFHLQMSGRQGILNDTFTTGVRSWDGTKSGNLSRNYHYLVGTKSKYQDMGWMFLKWMNQGPAFHMQDYMTNIFGFVPTVKGAAMPPMFTQQMKDAFTASMSTDYQTGMPVMKGLPALEKMLRDNDDLLLLGKLNADDYTTKVDSEAKAIIQQAYS